MSEKNYMPSSASTHLLPIFSYCFSHSYFSPSYSLTTVPIPSSIWNCCWVFQISQRPLSASFILVISQTPLFFSAMIFYLCQTSSLIFLSLKTCCHHSKTELSPCFIWALNLFNGSVLSKSCLGWPVDYSNQDFLADKETPMNRKEKTTRDIGEYERGKVFLIFSNRY